jgi:hypothetical protein
MQFAENFQANWQEGYCFTMTMPNPIQTEQPRGEFKNHSGNFLNIRLTSRTWFLVTHLFGPLKDHLDDKCFADNEEVETEVRKWRRKWSKHFYAAGFDALVKRWQKCINVDAGCGEKKNVQFRISYILHFISTCHMFTDSPS